MVFREVSVIEIREALRAWLAGKSERAVAAQAGVDRKTSRRYVTAAVAAGLSREGGEEQLTVAGLAEEAKAGPLPELGKQVPGFYAEPAREFAAGPVLAGLAGHDAGDLVSSAVRAGLARAGRLVRAAGARG